MEAMLQMTTLDIGQLEAASRGDLAATTSH